jgi:hypothetical protein
MLGSDFAATERHGQELTVVTYYKHPEFNPASLKNDIAVAANNFYCLPNGQK